jgi:bifunctional non-homologous end joining protein LigD
MPLPLRRMREPFDHAEWLFELKYDGFRALAYVRPDGPELVSRNGNRFGQFATLAAELRASLRVPSAVLDGEVVCLDDEGRPEFNALLFRRGTPVFVAYDVLAIGARDVRPLPLLRRKALLRRILQPAPTSVLYADHVTGAGRKFFASVCAQDLEGIVAKLMRGAYAEPTTWIKIKNRDYTGARDRYELMG